jgi:hypothetical protein
MGSSGKVDAIEARVGFGARASWRLSLVTSELLNQLLYALPGMQFRRPACQSVTIIGPTLSRMKKKASGWSGNANAAASHKSRLFAGNGSL